MDTANKRGEPFNPAQEVGTKKKRLKYNYKFSNYRTMVVNLIMHVEMLKIWLKIWLK